MSSTWFRGMRAISCEMDCGTDMNNPYKRTGYILIADTAESNVTTDSGAHPYSEWIYAAGEYDDIVKQVCEGSYNFETGMDKWKPHHKDAAGFIRSCKKALENAEQRSCIPAGVYPQLFWACDTPDNKPLLDVLESVPTLRKVKRYGDFCFTTDFVETYIRARMLIDSVFRRYREDIYLKADSIDFGKWFDEYIIKSNYWKVFIDRLRSVGGVE